MSNETILAGEDATHAVIRGVVMNELPQDLYIPPDALEVILEAFEGPLDLLLYLIRKQNLDILDIPIADITRQYMEYVEIMRVAKLDLAAEYLLMAAMLAEIKSRMLLPRQHEADEDDEDPRAALVRRLQEYERFRQAASDLDEIPRVDRDVYLASAPYVDQSPELRQPKVNIEDLALAFQNVLARLDQSRHVAITREALSLRERMTTILNRLQDNEFAQFEDLFSIEEGRSGVVVSFIAILELFKDELLVVVQNEPFAPIHIRAAA